MTTELPEWIDRDGDVWTEVRPGELHFKHPLSSDKLSFRQVESHFGPLTRRLSLYVAGPMRGVAAFNFPAFDEAEQQLTRLGHEVFSPAARDRATGFDPSDMDGTEDLAALGFSLREALAADTEWITKHADAVIVLPGWEQSSGARSEVALAAALGIPAWTLGDFLDPDPQMVDQTAVLSQQRQTITVVDPFSLPASATQKLADELARPLHLLGSDEVRVIDPATGGAKGQKPCQLGSVDPMALEALGRVSGFGATKYERGNYLRGYDWSLSVDALYRHFLAFQAGEDRDPESGELHTAHVAWHGLALCSFTLRGLGTDDRFEAAS